MTRAKIVKLEYRFGERFTVDGVKGHWGGRREEGVYFRNAGYGVGEAFRPSLLLLHTTYRGKKLVVRIDRFFKEKLGKLIGVRRQLIEMAMPKEVSVQRLKKKEVVTCPLDTVLPVEFAYEVITADLEEWFSRVNSFTVEQIAEAKQLSVLAKEARKKEERRQELEEDYRLEQIYRKCEAARRQRQRRWRKKIDALIAQGDPNYLKATFSVGQNRKTGEGQFEFQSNGKLYVLHRQDSFVEPKGEQYIRIERELVPGRVFLVRKEECL